VAKQKVVSSWDVSSWPESLEWSRENIRGAVWNALHGRDMHRLTPAEVLKVVRGAIRITLKDFKEHILAAEKSR
jgi:hypothetical protein